MLPKCVLCCGLAAISLWGAQNRSGAPSAGLTDAQLEAAIRERFARSRVAEDGFTVRVQGGVAIIEGRTNVIQRKGAATRMAKSAGAKKVINKVEVNEAARLKASGNLTTGRRRVQVRRSEAGSQTPPRR
jgi:hypothetical protein